MSHALMFSKEMYFNVYLVIEKTGVNKLLTMTKIFVRIIIATN